MGDGHLGEHGLIVHRGSRIERLAQTLAGLLDEQRSTDPLQAQTIVVAHPGMQRWLLGVLANRRIPGGGHPIAANPDMVLPWQWLHRLTRDVLGEDADAERGWRHEALRWSILAALDEADEPALRALLADGDARRRFRLADRLAGVYTQYLIYRADWIRQWETGARTDDWQASLWRRLRRRIAAPHRADRVARLRDAVAHAPPLRSPLHVFGVSHLAPDLLAILRMLAIRSEVHIHFPDPCREHWSYLRSRRDLLRFEGDAQALYYEVGHPLLVSLGRIAQDFCITLEELDADDLRDPGEEDDSCVKQRSLLDRLQAGLRRMQPELVGETFRAAPGSATEELLAARLRPLRADASLRVHACHTRLRELEVLKDALLRHLADDSALRHRDIVVMAPDIAAYAPYLPAVFGEAARYRNDPLHVPWHIADVGLASTHPLVGGLARLLDLGESRFAVSEVLGLLDVPALARRFGFDDEGREALERWLRRAHVAWGLDAAMKADVGAAPVAMNSWQFGLDRMYAGLVVGNEGEDALVDGILPLDGVSGMSTEAIGRLDRLLAELRRLREGYAQPRSLADWRTWLLERVDALFRIDPRDEGERVAMDALRRRVAELAIEAGDAGFDAPLPWAIVREALLAKLSAVPERQAFLLGGVTFCGLVPQRSLPFRLVCLLGMNEGEFPRVAADGGLNRMSARPLRGDRETRAEDRYLFLEALMAARARLHVSYIGCGVHDGKPRNPAGPVSELLQYLDEQHGVAAEASIDRPWHIHHPLQPFDPRYYEVAADGRREDERLYSYDRTWLAAGDPACGEGRPFLDLAAPPATATASADSEIALGSLRRFWKDPARAAIEQAGIGLDALDDASWPDREPLESRVAPLDRFDRGLLLDALSCGRAVPDRPPPLLAGSGRLAVGRIGEATYAKARDAALALLDPSRQMLGAPALREPQAVSVDLGDGLRVTGRVERSYRTRDGLVLFDAKASGQAGLREWIDFYIEWAALRLGCDSGAAAGYFEHDDSVQEPRWLASLRAQSEDQLRDGLRQLANRFRDAANRPLLFFPRTAYAYAKASEERRRDEAEKAWLGDEGSSIRRGERDYAPGHAHLLARDLDILDETTPAHREFVSTIEAIAAVLDPERRVLFAPPRSRGGKG
jgi:exodeoxyribonuclease V gamma subunit